MMYENRKKKFLEICARSYITLYTVTLRGGGNLYSYLNIDKHFIINVADDNIKTTGQICPLHHSKQGEVLKHKN
jgi:nitrite reductase/ring-hydroxylating ferredoxin subunit